MDQLRDGSIARLHRGALPGGPGTLAEISIMWNLIIIEAITAKPLILIGNGWKEVLSTFFEVQGQYISEPDLERIIFIESINEAPQTISKFLVK